MAQYRGSGHRSRLDGDALRSRPTHGDLARDDVDRPTPELDIHRQFYFHDHPGEEGLPTSYAEALRNRPSSATHGSLADPLPSGCQPREIGNPAGARRRRRGGGADPARHRGTGRGRCLRLRRSHVAPSRIGDRYGCFAAQALFHRCRQPTRAPSIWRLV